MMLKVENEDVSLQTVHSEIASRLSSYLDCLLQLLRHSGT